MSVMKSINMYGYSPDRSLQDIVFWQYSYLADGPSYFMSQPWYADIRALIEIMKEQPFYSEIYHAFRAGNIEEVLLKVDQVDFSVYAKTLCTTETVSILENLLISLEMVPSADVRERCKPVVLKWVREVTGLRDFQLEKIDLRWAFSLLEPRLNLRDLDFQFVTDVMEKDMYHAASRCSAVQFDVFRTMPTLWKEHLINAVMSDSRSDDMTRWAVQKILTTMQAMILPEEAQLREKIQSVLNRNLGG
jgi:hypothetical protein